MAQRSRFETWTAAGLVGLIVWLVSWTYWSVTHPKSVVSTVDQQALQQMLAEQKKIDASIDQAMEMSIKGDHAGAGKKYADSAAIVRESPVLRDSMSLKKGEPSILEQMALMEYQLAGKGEAYRTELKQRYPTWDTKSQ